MKWYQRGFEKVDFSDSEFHIPPDARVSLRENGGLVLPTRVQQGKLHRTEDGDYDDLVTLTGDQVKEGKESDKKIASPESVKVSRNMNSLAGTCS